MTPPNRRCVVCDNDSSFIVRKSTTDYFQCNNCKTVFCDELDNSGKVGGEHEVGRNEQQNHIRIARVEEMILGSRKEDVRILDFGAGHGYLIGDLKKARFPVVDGYDAYNEEYAILPKRNTYHIVTMIECVEHLCQPYFELDVIFRSLMQGGCIMIESGFTDVAKEDGVRIEDYLYVNPSAGHSTIFSHHGLDLLMALKGFIPRQHFDRNVRLFQKPFTK